MEAILAKALGEDVTKLAAEEKQRLLSRLLARLAHEIRNPLSSLDIHVQLLEEDLAHLAPETRDRLSPRLEIIHGELHRLENTVKQFLRLAGPSALNFAPVQIENIIGRIRSLLQPEADARQIELVANIVTGNDRALPSIKADADQLIQALLNLVINALQAVERKGRVELRASKAEDSIIIRVCDTGPGVPAERLSAIFEPYYTTRTDGTGIGLWIAQQIILAHGGNIQVANDATRGAIFTVRLPIQQRPIAEEAP